MKQYHTLLAREHGRWAIQFGDFDRATVIAERDDYKDAGTYLLREMKVITTGPRQAEIDAAVAKLNERA